MTKSTIKAVIFDLGNVLVDFDHTIAARRILPFCQRTLDEIYAFFFDSSLTGLFEEGAISPGDFFKEVSRSLDLQLSYAEFIPIWNEIFFLSAKNERVHAVARQLQSAYRVGVLSNINVLHYDYIKKHFPIFAGFSAVVASCEQGSRKPDPRIYRHILDALGVQPEEAFYTDDRSDLIAKAVALGIQSHVFTGVEPLIEALNGAGVETGDVRPRIS